MRIAVVGIGVIGTTYAFAFQKAGHDTYHIMREGKKDIPNCKRCKRQAGWCNEYYKEAEYQGNDSPFL